MGDLLLAAQAEAKIFQYKLSKIRDFCENRKSIVDAVMKAEFDYILDIIKKYESIPATWALNKPLVDIPLKVQKEMQAEREKKEKEYEDLLTNCVTTTNNVETGGINNAE